MVGGTWLSRMVMLVPAGFAWNAVRDRQSCAFAQVRASTLLAVMSRGAAVVTALGSAAGYRSSPVKKRGRNGR